MQPEDLRRLRRRERAQSSLRFNGIYYFVYMLIAIPIVVALAFRLNSFDIYVLKVRTQAPASPRRSLPLSCRLLPSVRRSAKHSPMPSVCSSA